MVFTFVILSYGGYMYYLQQPSNEKSVLEPISLVIIVLLIMGGVFLKISRNNQSIPKPLRVIGWLVFFIWIASLILRSIHS